MAKLTKEKVHEMRRLRGKGMSFPKLAAMFGITLNAVWCAVTGRTWAHVIEDSNHERIGKIEFIGGSEARAKQKAELHEVT